MSYVCRSVWSHQQVVNMSHCSCNNFSLLCFWGVISVIADVLTMLYKTQRRSYQSTVGLSSNVNNININLHDFFPMFVMQIMIIKVITPSRAKFDLILDKKFLLFLVVTLTFGKSLFSCNSTKLVSTVISYLLTKFHLWLIAMIHSYNSSS